MLTFKKASYFGLVAIMLMALLMLSGCNIRSIAGRWSNGANPDSYFMFGRGGISNEGDVTLNLAGEIFTGTYSVAGRHLHMRLYNNDGVLVSTQSSTFNNDRTTFGWSVPDHGDVWIRGGADDSGGIPWWGWAIIVVVGLSIIGKISDMFQKKSGKSVE